MDQAVTVKEVISVETASSRSHREQGPGFFQRLATRINGPRRRSLVDDEPETESREEPALQSTRAEMSAAETVRGSSVRREAPPATSRQPVVRRESGRAERVLDLEAWLADTAEAVEVPTERVHPEFAHLYATLERCIARDETAAARSGERNAKVTKLIGITSAVAGEGKTTVALNLAVTIARDTYHRVCLIDLSLNEDELCRRLEIALQGDGVVDLLEGGSGTLARLEVNGPEGFTIIPAGRAPANASRAARSPRAAELLRAAREYYDLIIVDLPSVTSHNLLPLARYMDGMIVVARAGVTPAPVIRRALEQLEPDKLLGVVLNGVESAAA